MKINEATKRTEWLTNVMKLPKYKNGIKSQDIYREARLNNDFDYIFGSANINNPDQWKHSLRQLIQLRCKNMKNWDGKHESFIRIGFSVYTYADNPLINKKVIDVIMDDISSLEQELKRISIKPVERTALINVRLNQGFFRKRLIEEFKACPVRKIKRKELLIASHILDYKDCKEEFDKANPQNGLLLTADFDKLFDNKLISFHYKTGKIIISKEISDSLLNKLHIDRTYHMPEQYMNPARSSYFKERNSKYAISV